MTVSSAQQKNVTLSVCLIHRQNIVVSMVIVMWIQKENQDVCKLRLFLLFRSGIKGESGYCV
jgi:hypothetical protein